MTVALRIEDQSCNLSIFGIDVDAYKYLGTVHMNPDVTYGQVSMYMGPWESYRVVEVQSVDDLFDRIEAELAAPQFAEHLAEEEIDHAPFEDQCEEEDSNPAPSKEASVNEASYPAPEAARKRVDKRPLTFISVNGKQGV
jgi:hypothetical protein